VDAYDELCKVLDEELQRAFDAEMWKAIEPILEEARKEEAIKNTTESDGKHSLFSDTYPNLQKDS